MGIAGSDSTKVALKVNDVELSYKWGVNLYSTFGMQQVLKLNAGDQVSLRLKAGSVFDKQTPQTHFTGIQLPKGLAYFTALKNQSFDVANANVAVSYCYISKILQLMGCNKCSS